jgi:hypothetical protein
MISIIIEPQDDYTARSLKPQSMTAREITKNPPQIYGPRPNDGYWASLALEVVQRNGGEPIRITTVVNSMARVFHFTSRADREAKKLQFLKLVGKLIREGRLERVARKFVNTPLTDERHRAYLAKWAAPLNLPPPCM